MWRRAVKCCLLDKLQPMQCQPQQQRQLPAVALQEIVSIKSLGGSDQVLISAKLWASEGLWGEQHLYVNIYPLTSPLGANGQI